MAVTGAMIVMFAPEGCVINGVDSELYRLGGKTSPCRRPDRWDALCFAKTHGQPRGQKVETL